jgi:hypothetical protein
MRRNVAEQYRDWVWSGAYWRRAWDKWIVGERVFYTDEFWHDLIGSLIAGFGVNIAYLLAFGSLLGGPANVQALLPAAASSPVFLFLCRQWDRWAVSGAELRLRQRVDPSFTSAAEVERLLTAEPNYVRRVLGRYARPSTSTGG